MLKKLFKERVDPNVIEKIHEDFDEAANSLYDKACEILDEESKILKENALEKLSEFGFRNVAEVKYYNEVKETIGDAKSVKDKIEYYRKTYPNNRFVSKSQVKDICKKYGLYFGETGRYIGEIPDKNKLEILQFNVKKADSRLSNPSTTYNPEKVMIVASKDEFDMNNMTVGDGWELKELPKDPIVLYPVYGGYLVVSKWGKEENIDELK